MREYFGSVKMKNGMGFQQAISYENNEFHSSTRYDMIKKYM